MRISLSRLLLAGFVFSISGCGSEEPDFYTPHRYFGSYVSRTAGTSFNHPISAESFPDPKNNKVEIRIQDLEDPRNNLNFVLFLKSSDEIELVESHPNPPSNGVTNPANDGSNPLTDPPKPVALEKQPRSCFLSNEIQTCFGQMTLTFSKAVKKKTAEDEELWVLSQTEGQAPPTFEAPAKHSVADLMERSMSYDFNARIEFEHMTQAKLMTKGAYQGLLPSLDLGSIGAVLTPNLLGAISAIGDLAPFLLPERWIRAAQYGKLELAEIDALFLMKVNAAATTEGLGLALARDEKILNYLDEQKARVLAWHDQIRDREAHRRSPTGSAQVMDLLVSRLDKAKLALQAVVQNEYRALSQSAGFFNPNAISSLDPLPTDQAQCDGLILPLEGDESRIRSFALNQSFELRQMDHLIAAAELSKKEKYFSWLDPSWAYNNDDGIPFMSKVAVGESRIAELQIVKQQLQTTIIQKTQSTLDAIKTAKKQVALCKAEAETQSLRLNRMAEALNSGDSFSALEFSTAIQEKMRNDTELLTAQTDCQAAFGRLNRIVLQGIYARAVLPLK